MKIYKTRLFAKWAKKNKVIDHALVQALEEVSQGLVDAALGGALYKKRVPTSGRGKRSSFRTILVYQAGSAAFFVYGYAKNAKSNLTEKEQYLLRKLADELLSYNSQQLLKLTKQDELVQI